MNCSILNGWYDSGSPYVCCDGTTNVATCQNKEYRTYSCASQACTYVVTQNKTEKTGSAACQSGYSCQSGSCKCDAAKCAALGKSCVNGKCCSSECTPSEQRCDAANQYAYKACVNPDDTCWKWSQAMNCPEGQACFNGNCIPSDSISVCYNATFTDGTRLAGLNSTSAVFSFSDYESGKHSWQGVKVNGVEHPGKNIVFTQNLVEGVNTIEYISNNGDYDQCDINNAFNSWVSINGSAAKTLTTPSNSADGSCPIGYNNSNGWISTMCCLGPRYWNCCWNHYYTKITVNSYACCKPKTDAQLCAQAGR
jgi:hypothetical protein